MSIIKSSILKISSFNCRGFNSTKACYIASLMSKCNIMFLQEHWLSDAQLSSLSSISDGVSFHAISGFGNSDVLAGRPYGGCAILYQSALLLDMCPISVDSRRICAVRVCFDSIKLLLVNVYMPYGDDDANIDEFVNVLALVDDLIHGNSDCHLVLGGDFNVDFRRNRSHTALLSAFCEDIGLMPTFHHSSYKVDYTYNFNMSRFSIIDHFILSTALHNECLSDVIVLHDIDNLSDHEPIVLQLNIDVTSIALCSRIFAPHMSWVKASESNINDYRCTLSTNLKRIELPVATLLCSDMRCTNAVHLKALNQYAAAVTDACLSAAESNIPHTSSRLTAGPRRIPGWSERVEPHREKSLFWHGLWVDCGRPRGGVVADCMRRTRASYHYAIRQVKRDEDSIVRDRLANALINDPSRNFWSEVKRIRNNKMCTTNVVDGCTDKSTIAQLFANKYRSLYSSVSFNDAEMRDIRIGLEAHMLDGGLSKSDHIFTTADVITAFERLNQHKNDGTSNGLSTDHFIHAGLDLAIFIAFLFTCMVTHGFSPIDFGVSTIIPIPKKHHSTDSNNFRGIALSSVFVSFLII
jgi:exonuclease III